eukprot:CAMPEP_0113603596 /NCGR_PEP_ID=MMETSP0017_2-20120614/1359_1 /TAXON_ID=2856 /ORGANISM="Cylindrotheca closterium" /LENGTH=337 /DNA_ID=CAMNT_0000511991 /DNA_START=21 /DNA_END=1031 /DNA_ORIENTATION=- /assembly_acc=CAM_ASM_000147
MAAKQRKATSKTQKKKTTRNSSKSEKTKTKDDSVNDTTSTASSSSQARLLSPISAMISFVAVAVAIYVANRQLSTVPTYHGHVNSPSKPWEPSAPTVNTLKWAGFDGVATITKAYRVLKMVDHDPTAFTQGLQVHQNHLVESTGLYGESLVRIWDPHTGIIAKETPKLDEKYFAEGLTHYQDENGDDRYILLTWKEQTAFIYDMDLNVINSFEYETKTKEGWGITFDPVQKVFFVSDGSSHLHIWNLNFEEIRRFSVSYQVDPAAADRMEVMYINELEWDTTDGTILANVWFQNVILRIDPGNGQVLQIYDLSDLYVDRAETADCLNGIAHQGGNQW